MPCARAVGAVGPGWGSSNAGPAGRRSLVRVGIRCCPCRQRSMGGPVASEAGRSPSSGCPLPGGCRGPPPTCCGRRCAGVGARHCPLCLHALWRLRAAGVAAVPAPAPQRGALASRCCVLWGRQKGVPGCLLSLWGASEFGRVPLSGCPPLGGLPGPATRGLWPRVCECGGPALSPWLACPFGAVCRGGGGGPSPGGVVCPSPCRPSSGTGGLGSATCVSWVWLL